MYNLVRRALVVLSGMMLLLAGCIQPINEVDQTKTVQATLGVFPTAQAAVQPPATQPPTNPVVAPTNTPVLDIRGSVEQFIRLRGDAPEGLLLWGDEYRGADRYIGFSFTGTTGTACAGFLVFVSGNNLWQPTDSGALVCAQAASADAFAGSTFILTAAGEPSTIVFGQVSNPAVSMVEVAFQDGASQRADVSSGGFLVVKPGVAGPTTLTGIDAQGNPVVPSIPHTPA